MSYTFPLLSRNLPLLIWLAPNILLGEELMGSQSVVLYGLFDLWSMRYCLEKDLFNPRLQIYLFSFMALTGFVVLTLLLSSLLQKHHTKKLPQWSDVNCSSPLILRCRTKHTRMFPKKHSFEYPYLLVSVPVTTDQQPSWFLETEISKMSSLFSLDPSEYLNRDDRSGTLKQRLNEYLVSQRIEPTEWKNAYLVTAPKFLGYSFNPISFWYVYDANDQLYAMVQEVNNTFGERRIYLSKFEADVGPRYHDKWNKDFHVSPFNSRKGAYSLAATSPYRGQKYHFPGIDNTIVLKSSKDHVKLVARVFSDDVPLLPEQLSYWDIGQFLLQWCWLGLFTYPRILKEAFVLFFRRFLHIWLRPEVQPTSIGRVATTTEKLIEPVFTSYFKHLQTKLADALRLECTELDDSKAFASSRTTDYIRVKILSPSFYLRFLRYPTLAEAIKQEGILPTDRKRTIAVEMSEACDLSKLEKLERTEENGLPPLSKLGGLKWQIVDWLRYMANQGSLAPVEKYYLSSSFRIPSYRPLLSRELLANILARGHSEVIFILGFGIRCIFLYMALVKNARLSMSEALASGAWLTAANMWSWLIS